VIAKLLPGICVLCWLCLQAAAQPADAPALQSVLEHSMRGRPGAAVVIDAASGKILAAWNLNVAAQRLTPPGSTVKPLVLMELLNTGKLTAAKRLICRRPLYIAGKRMDCTHPPSVVALDAREAVAWSCNSYFAAAATQLSPTEMKGILQRAGFTARTGMASGEAAGYVALASDQPHVQLQALGDWGVAITPLELLAAYRKLALQKSRGAAAVYEGMEGAVEYGIAHTAKAEGIRVAGKTGTASGADTPFTHGFFAGYAPAENPEIVLVVYLEHGRGSDAAAIASPVFTAYAHTSHGALK
jgi:penicillin-binding protein 2